MLGGELAPSLRMKLSTPWARRLLNMVKAAEGMNLKGWKERRLIMSDDEGGQDEEGQDATGGRGEEPWA